MATKVVLELDVQGQELDQLNAELQQTEQSFKDVEKEAKKTSVAVDDVAGNGGAIAILDQLTGGLATRMRDAFEATKLFNVSLKGTKTALIATGIGAFVVALGLVVAHWDDIVDFIKGANHELDLQLQKTQELVIQTEQELDLLRARETVLLDSGLTQEQYNKLKKEGIEALILELEGELEIQRARLQHFEDIKKEGRKTFESILRGVVDFSNKAVQIFDNIFGTTLLSRVEQEQESTLQGLFGTDEEIKETTKVINDLEIKLAGLRGEIIEARKLREGDEGERDALPEATGVLDDGDVSNFFTGSLERLTQDANNLIDLDRDIADARIANEKYAQDQKTIAEEDGARRRAEIARIENAQKLMLASDTLGKLAALFGENTKAGKIAGSAQALINTYLGVTQVLANKTTLPEPFGTINKIASIATVLASGLKAVQQINSVQAPGLGSIGGGVSSSGGGIGGAVAQPSFNIVGDTGINQLNNTISAQNGEPTRAYVVQSDLEKGMSLERNAVAGASL